MYQLDSAEKLRANWKYLSAEEIQQLLTDEIVDIIFTAITNMQVQYRTYSGRVDVIAYYRYVATGETIVQKSAETLNVSPETAYMVAGLVVMQEPGVQVMLVSANNGVMPEIKPPLAPIVVEIPSDPEPIDEPQPAPEDETATD
ncbi:hypothetical protein [Spirosoma sp. KUDC1026]|uniref:hypothetical protein n=1 Tax=Spirosoma sp. KUDC1026 TaxID=2745947 RepID=UPI00159BEEFE|nr:hypothetical protein [Spirosoma sp. KUDC1026]QKZ15182.1 hypothetical protein HU175_22175 [Spirosoma sp. KUDC1026]